MNGLWNVACITVLIITQTKSVQVFVCDKISVGYLILEVYYSGFHFTLFWNQICFFSRNSDPSIQIPETIFSGHFGSVDACFNAHTVLFFLCL